MSNEEQSPLDRYCAACGTHGDGVVIGVAMKGQNGWQRHPSYHPAGENVEVHLLACPNCGTVRVDLSELKQSGTKVIPR